MNNVITQIILPFGGSFLLLKYYDYNNILKYGGNVMYYLVFFSLIILYFIDSSYIMPFFSNYNTRLIITIFLVVLLNLYVYYLSRGPYYPNQVVKTNALMAFFISLIYLLFNYTKEDSILKTLCLNILLVSFGTSLTLIY